MRRDSPRSRVVRVNVGDDSTRTWQQQQRPRQGRGFCDASVEPVHHYSNKSALLPPPLVDLQRLADLVVNLSPPTMPAEQTPRLLRRRLDPALVAEIVEKYRSGATTPSLCTEYLISNGGLLNLLRTEGVQLRRQPLSDQQVREAVALYGNGKSLAAIAVHFDVSYNGVRQALMREGLNRRPRGSSRNEGDHGRNP